MFNQEEIKLRYTPRKMLLHPTTNYIITLETDHNTYPATISGGLRGKLLEAQQGGPSATGAKAEVKKEKMDDSEDGEKEAPKGKEEIVKDLDDKQREQANREEYERVFGAPRPGMLLALFRQTETRLMTKIRKALANGQAAFVSSTR